jgi:Lipocalin-like domain
MKMKYIQLWTLVVGMLALPVLSGPGATAAEPSAASRLVGTWKLVSIEERDASGNLVVPKDFGPEPAGILTYDAGGHMAAQAMRRGRPRLATEDVHRAAPEEAKAAFAGYAAYFGTYEVRESEGLVIHHVEGSLLPNWEGGDQKRRFTLSGDKLILEPPSFMAGGETRSRRLTWQRVQ